MSSGIHHENPKLRSKEKKVAPFNAKPKTKCACGKGLGYMQDKCTKCQKAANAKISGERSESDALPGSAAADHEERIVNG